MLEKTLERKIVAGVAALTGMAFSAAFAQPETASEKAVFDNWQYNCEGGVCQAVLTLADNKTNERLVSWSFVYDPPNDRLSAVITLPLGVALPVGLGVQLGDDQNLTWPFQVCDAEGCRAVAVIDEVTEAALGEAEEVQIRFVPYGAKGAVAVPIPMQGFEEAKEKLKSEPRP